MKTRYGMAKIGFLEIDFDGKGYISQEDFLKCVPGLKLPFDAKKIANLIEEQGDFDQCKGKMGF
jgi:hypothetical protein